MCQRNRADGSSEEEARKHCELEWERVSQRNWDLSFISKDLGRRRESDDFQVGGMVCRRKEEGRDTGIRNLFQEHGKMGLDGMESLFSSRVEENTED